MGVQKSAHRPQTFSLRSEGHPLILPVYYDFASTLCYVAHRVMQRLEPQLGELDIALEWRPLDLSLLTGWRRGAAFDAERRQNARQIAAELGVEVRMPTRWLDSRAAHAVALALIDTNKEPTWRERVWSAVFEEGRDIGEAGEVERIATDIGLTVTVVDLDRPDRLDADTHAARAIGVTGVPTFLLGEWPMGGIQDDQTMLGVLRRFRARRTNED